MGKNVSSFQMGYSKPSVYRCLTLSTNLLYHDTKIWKGQLQGGTTRPEAVDCVWNVMARAQKPDLDFRRNGRVHLNRRGRQFSRLLAAELCASAVVMLDTTCSELGWRVLATHSIRQFPLHFPAPASPCAMTFKLESTSCIYTVYLLMMCYKYARNM